MDDSLFLARMNVHKNSVPTMYLSHADEIMNRTFDRDATYKIGNIYDTDCQLLEQTEFKYQKAYSYSVNKDKVEFLVQFRPQYHPEVKFRKADKMERYGFYLDIPNDAGVVEKWLIFGKNETNSFIRYNVLRCNWTFKWIHDGIIYTVLGVLRNRNNYNSGVWSDGFVTTVENEAMFILPGNDDTKTINYDDRFMITDNDIYPKVYKVTKVEDTFPPGIVRLTLTQDHYDAALDNVKMRLCNFYDSAIVPKDKKFPDWDRRAKLTCSGANNILHIDGSKRRITAVIYDEKGNPTEETAVWHFYINDVEKTWEELESFGITWKVWTPNQYDFKAIQGATTGTILKIRIFNGEWSEYTATIELEVQA